MSDENANITVPVDLTNPGQFFACCGLLELAARIDPKALAQFDSGQFIVHADVDVVLNRLFSCTVDVETTAIVKNCDEDDGTDDGDDVDLYRGRIYPMTLGAPFNLRLDWWNDEEAQKQKLKTWTAGQRVTDLLVGHHKKTRRKGQTHLTPIPSMREHFAEVVSNFPEDWLRTALPIEAPMAFSYDSRLSRNNALDQGHTSKSIMAFSPAVDVLALIGLQRFRPLMVTQWSRNFFCTWREAIPVEIATVAMLGLIPHFIDNWYEFPIIRRDSQGRFKLFGHAQPTRRPNV